MREIEAKLKRMPWSPCASHSPCRALGWESSNATLHNKLKNTNLNSKCKLHLGASVRHVWIAQPKLLNNIIWRKKNRVIPFFKVVIQGPSLKSIWTFQGLLLYQNVLNYKQEILKKETEYFFQIQIISLKSHKNNKTTYV